MAGIDLTPYFFLSRDRVSDGGASSRLPPGLQILVADLESEAASIREAAIDTVKNMSAEEQLMLLEASAARLKALPDKQPMMKSMIEVAASQPSLVSVAVAALASIPYSQVTPDIPLVVASNFKGADATAPATELLATWEEQSTSPSLSKAALMARRRIGGDNGDV